MPGPELDIRPNVYYTPEEAASLLRVPRKELRLLLEQTEALGVRVGGQWRVLGRELLSLPHSADSGAGRLVDGLMRLSEPSFAEAWGSDEDNVYDAL